MFIFKQDYEKTMERFRALMECEVIDRAPVNITIMKEGWTELPVRQYESWEEKWHDLEYRTEEQVDRLQGTIFLGDSLPVAWPNMGPEIFSAWCGCGYNYGERTTWSEPCINDWDRDKGKGFLDRNNPLLKKTIEYTDMLIEASEGRFIVGLTDFHPGGDHLAALRNPQELCFDMIENPEHVRKKLDDSYPEYFEMYDLFYEKLRNAGMPATSWTPLAFDEKFYIPSNDFSCMISKRTFDDIFLPGIERECRFLDKSIYHLDGPGALHHLDSLLEIKELDAIQWVFGAGNEGFAKWIPVYRKILDSGKAVQVILDISELDLLFENFKPEGIWLSSISGIDDMETAEYVLKRVEEWK